MTDNVIEAKTKKKAEYKLAKGGKLCLPDFPVELTDEDLTNDRVLSAVAAYEARKGIKVFGKFIVSK